MTIPPNPHPEQVERLARKVLAATMTASGLESDARLLLKRVEGEELTVDWEDAIRAMLAFASLANRPADDGERQTDGFRWSFNSDTRDIEFGASPVFHVYVASDFPCIEDEERADTDQWYDAQAQTAVLMLNGLLHDSGDDSPIPMPSQPEGAKRP